MSSRGWLVLLIVSPAWAQGTPSTNAPSLSDAVQWLQNTLDPSTGNGYFVHHPFRQPYPADWKKEGINPYHSELIKHFSVADCHVTVSTLTTDQDMGFTIGKRITSEQTDTFNLADVDPRSIRLQRACEPVETSSGPTEPFNCQDSEGKMLGFSITNNVKKIHREEAGSVSLTEHGKEQAKKYPDLPSGEQPWQQDNPTDLYQDTLSFHDPAYAARFVKAFTRAVELCGGKRSAF